MDFVGRMFVFLVFTMSLVFSSFAVFVYALHKDHRSKVILTEEEWKEKAARHEHKGLQYLAEDEIKNRDKQAAEKDKRKGERQVQRNLRRRYLVNLEKELSRLEEIDRVAHETQLKLYEGHEDAIEAVEKVHRPVAEKTLLEKEFSNILTLSDEIDQLRLQIRKDRNEIDERFDKVLVLTEQVHLSEAQRRLLLKRYQGLRRQLYEARQVLLKARAR